MSVTRTYRYVCCEMKCFFKVFMNHFPKIHRSVLRKIAIDLLYFWDVYDVNLLEENFIRSTTRSCRTNVFEGKNRFKEKRDSNTGVFLWNLWNFPKQWWLLLKTRNILLRNEKLRSGWFSHLQRRPFILLHLLLTR